MLDRPRTRPCETLRRPARCRGFTLVELAMVLGIIGLVALSALVAYKVVVAQHHSAKALADVTAVRAAVLKWAGGGPLAYPATTGGSANSRTLQQWDSLAPHLPAHLKKLADGDSDLHLDGANPWSGRYAILPPTPSDPMHWELRIDEIPCALMEELEHQLSKTSYDKSSAGILATACSSGTASLTVPYEE